MRTIRATGPFGGRRVVVAPAVVFLPGPAPVVVTVVGVVCEGDVVVGGAGSALT